MPLKAAFGRALRDLRVQRGWTAMELASRLGIPEPQLAEWEQGQEVPTPAMLAALAALFQHQARAERQDQDADAQDATPDGEQLDA